MIIDIHQHITYREFPEFNTKMHFGNGVFTADDLVEDMDKWGIDQSAVLPLVNPENSDFFGVAGNQEVILECRKHPDRFIPFCNIDPRFMLNTPDANLSDIIRVFKDLGCRGIGEVCANIFVTDPRYKNLFYHAGEEQMPVLFHLTAKNENTYGMIDSLGLNGLEEVLKEFPNTIFIGHAPAFWNEIDGELKEEDREGYFSERPISKWGALVRLMESYPNLYADISSGSGHMALTRDPQKGIEFINKFHQKILFGTDLFYVKNSPPVHLELLKLLKRTNAITETAWENITHKNAEKILA